jgi:hypothetical protein
MAFAWAEEAPPGADRVRIRFMGVEQELDVQGGYCVFVARDVPGDEIPRITASKKNGLWS